jgi:ribosomal protein S18 acetylase RimI-like enzyme
VAFLFQITALDKERHDRSGFRCGAASLDIYLKERAAQDMRRRFAACYVALTEAQRVIGYYTLSSADLPLRDLPEEMARKLPRYPNVPAALLGRLAVDQDFQRRGLGGVLLVDAIQRTKRSEIASYGLLVDAKDESAKSFYRNHGFVSLPESPQKLFLPLA